MKPAAIHLGFEVGSGKSVEIPLKHLCITGQTQESGKTTTLEGLITRSGLRAIAFITKRGEVSFDSGRQILPYFEERADWEFIESVLEATMHQKMKFERAWIVKACKGARSLADVQRNVAELQARSKRSMDQDLFMLLGEYLAKVVPLIQALPKSAAVDLAPGLNVMDLRPYPEELQHLVISSTIRWIYQHERDVITIVPEAWKFAPQGRNTPVKVEIRKLAREGAGLKNYIWIDSQDIAGVEKEILRAAAVWLLGVQREANEISRSLGSIPKGIKRPKEGEIPRLKLGEFFACWGEHVSKVYVQPAWMSEADALNVARGMYSAAKLAAGRAENRKEEDVEDWKALYEQEKAKVDNLQTQVTLLEEQLLKLSRQQKMQESTSAAAPPKPREYTPAESLDNEQLYQAIKKRLQEEAPALIKLMVTQPEIEVAINRNTVSMGDSSIRGKIALLIHEGWFDTPRDFQAVRKELIRRGINSKTANPAFGGALKELVGMGFFWLSGAGTYELAPGARKRVAAA